jgi:hypothetical protein
MKMFDINNAVNTAIETAVQERFTEMAQQYANNVGAMAEIIAKLDTRIAELEEANTVLVERINAVQPTPPIDEVPEDWAKRDQLTNEFVSKLNDQEWFWNKVNAYVDSHIERVYGTPIDRTEAADIAKDTFDYEWKRKVGSNDLLGRDEVADIVRELWSDEFEDEVDDKVDRAVDNIDLSEAVRDVVRDLSFSVSVD